MNTTPFPDKLLDWSGHRSGGVRKLFHHQAERPSGELIRTSLLERLEGWVGEIVSGKDGTPRIVLLVGGPGNGKTEAIEACIRRVDDAGGLQGNLISELAEKFSKDTDRPVPRLVVADVKAISSGRLNFDIAIVQDASVRDPAFPGKSPPELLLSDLEKFTLSDSNTVYLACVNRGVLDDAFSAAIDTNRDDARSLLAMVIRAVGLAADAPSCWPLAGYPAIAIWPMDVESLLVPTTHHEHSPARQLLDIATNISAWPEYGSCPAGELCPHCTSRKWLGDARRRDNLLTLLRWYELASGKRWSFRDLGSLVSFMLAGVQGSGGEGAKSPCQSAATLIAADVAASDRTTAQGSESLFLLMAMLYQHSLFGKWPKSPGRRLRDDMRAIGLEKNPTLMGFYQFLNGQRRRSIPSTLERQLENLCDLMDPAIADPDEKVEVSSRSELQLRDVDAHFSQSVSEGLSFVSPYRTLAPVEVELLKRLGKVDIELSTPSVRNLSPASAARIQMQIREFSCRLIRRSLGVQGGVARDARILSGYAKVMDQDDELMRGVVKQVEALLNEQSHFITHLNTTFGEPTPPRARRATLTTTKQKVLPEPDRTEGRPPSTLRFLRVGNPGARQSFPLTFELFKSVIELGQGLLPAVLPRTVVALLDTTRARLSGVIVRDDELLEGAEIRIGMRIETVVRELGRFVVQRDAPK